MSAVNVEEPPRIPSGTWSLLIHGNCPRCNHHHRATTVRFRVSDDPSEATPVQCENCEHRWLTIGGRNKTQTSLLSTQTVDLDNEEISFRTALFKFVRSATSLDSVPESSARDQNHGDTTLRSSKDVHRDQEVSANNEVAPPNNMHDPATDTDTVTMPPMTPGAQSVRRELMSNNIKLAKVLLNDLKRKLRRHIPVLKRVHLHNHTKTNSSGQRIDSSKPPQLSKVKQELVAPRPPSPRQDLIHQETEETDASARQVHDDNCVPAKTTAQAIEEFEGFGKDRVKAMTSEQRSAWIRERITGFKCRCSRQCTCRHRRASSSIMIDNSTQVHILPLLPCEELPRRHSLEGIGSHLSYFAPGEFLDRHSLTITATRTSEAETMVEGTTINSSPRNSRVGLPAHRHRSLSPRPASMRNARHSQHFRLEAQPSLDSMIATGAGVARSSSRGGRRRTERLSSPPPAITSHPEAPGHEEQATSIPVEAPQHIPTPPPPSEASTPRINGHMTNDEHSQPSMSPPETSEP